MNKKPYYKKWQFWTIIILVVGIIGIFTDDKGTKSTMQEENSINSIKPIYSIEKSEFTNSGKVKTEKLILEDESIEDNTIENIYNERKKYNKDVELIIWLYSTKEKAKNMNTAEIAAVKMDDNGKVIVTHFEKGKEQNHEQEQKNEIKIENNTNTSTTERKINNNNENVKKNSSDKTKSNLQTTDANVNTNNNTNNEGNSMTVYITPTGKRYHYSSSCGGENSKPTTKADAISRGLTPCKKCTN